MTTSGGIFDIDSRKEIIGTLEKESSVPEFWSDRNKAQEVLKKLTAEKEQVAAYEKVLRTFEELREYVALAAEEEDESAIESIADEYRALKQDVETLEVQKMLGGENDESDAILTIHPGAGFLLKIWPTQNYADLIEALFELFPSLDCKIILGKDDPNPVKLLSKEYAHIKLVTGDLHDVGEAMAGALFHIGNDAGITHVAG